MNNVGTTMLAKLYLTPRGVRLMREALSFYQEGGVLSFEAGRGNVDRLRCALRSAREDSLECDNTAEIRDTMIGVLRTVEETGPSHLAGSLRELRGIVEDVRRPVVDGRDAWEELDTLHHAVHRWKRGILFKSYRLRTLAQRVYLPYMLAVEQQADRLTKGAARVHLSRFAHDLDVLDAMDRDTLLRSVRDVVAGAIHTVWGMHRMNASFASLAERIFKGDTQAAERAVHIRDELGPGSLIHGSYRAMGLFLRTVHGAETLRLLGAAEEYWERARYGGEAGRAEDMLRILDRRGQDLRDLVAEYSVLDLMWDGITLLREQGRADLDDITREVRLRSGTVRRRLVERSGTEPGY